MTAGHSHGKYMLQHELCRFLQKMNYTAGSWEVSLKFREWLCAIAIDLLPVQNVRTYLCRFHFENDKDAVYSKFNESH